MRTPATSAALALILALTLAGCASNDTDTDTADPAASASVMSSDPAASEPAMEKSDGEAREKTEDAAMTDGEAMAEEGAWIDQAAYDADPAKYHAAGDVVLFFNASWCPTCQATVKSLDADGTPAGLTVVNVDFDNADDLRQQYGVTVQHTFVQISANGKQIGKWTGSRTGKDIKRKTK